jgi:hypothetical protein
MVTGPAMVISPMKAANPVCASDLGQHLLPTTGFWQ